MKKFIALVAVAIVAGVGAWCFFGKEDGLLRSARNDAGKESAKPVVKIGVTLPLTGDMAFVGQPAKKAIELSFRDMKKEKKLKYDYEFLFEDDRLDSKNILLNYNRFKSVNHVNAVVSMWGNAVVITEPASRDGIIHFGCSWGYDLAKGKYNFNHSTFPDEQSDALIAEMQKRGVKKIGYIYNSTKGDVELTSVLKPKLAEAGIEVVWENMFNADQRDFKTDITKIKDKEVDVVLIMMLDPGMGIYVKQAKEQGYAPRYTSVSYFTYNPELFEGMWYITDALGTQAFMEHYKKETGEKPESSCVANLYDIVKILVNAYETAPVEDGKALPENQSVANAILSLRDFGSSTGYAKIDADGNIHTLPKLSIIKDGKPVVVEE